MKNFSAEHLRRLARDEAYTEAHAQVMLAAAEEIERLRDAEATLNRVYAELDQAREVGLAFRQANADINRGKGSQLKAFQTYARALESTLEKVRVEATKMLNEQGQSWNAISGRRILRAMGEEPKDPPREPGDDIGGDYDAELFEKRGG